MINQVAISKSLPNIEMKPNTEGIIKTIDRSFTDLQNYFTVKSRKNTIDATIQPIVIRSQENKLTFITIPIKKG